VGLNPIASSAVVSVPTGPPRAGSKAVSQKVVIVQEISRGLEAWIQDQGALVYAPKILSRVQSDYFEKRFREIQKVNPKAEFVKTREDLSIKAQDRVFAWDTSYENFDFGKTLESDAQNRLFSQVDFSVPDSYTGFRKKAEPLLPSYYSAAIAPVDQDAKDRIRYYFHDNKWPSTYFETRNQMVGDSFSSQFSGYLACGALDVRCLYNEIKDYEERNGSNKSTYWLVFELLWREFYYWHYQKVENSFFSANGIRGMEDFSDYTTYQPDELRRLSDHAFWQASLNEILETGFQSNRTRQLFASFWIHELDLHWRAGATFFEEHLIDYDVYSNWGNWMYLAGVGVDSWGSRRFNIEGQLERYDSDGLYLKTWG